MCSLFCHLPVRQAITELPVVADVTGGHMWNAGDHEVLSDMVANGGRAQMISEADKDRARRLVALDYATIVPVNVTALTIEITGRGRTAKVLADFGIWNPDFCAIEPQPSEMNGRWVIKVSTVSGSPVLLEIADATALVERLIEVGATLIARQFEAEVERARRYVSGRLFTEIG